MRGDIIVHIRLLPEGNTGIVRHHRHCKRQLHPFSLHICDSLRRIKMWHDQHIHRILCKIPVQIFGHAAIHIIHRRLSCQPAYQHSQLVYQPEKLRRLFDNLYIPVTHQPGYAFSSQCQVIHHISLISLPGHGFCNGSPCGIMSAASIAGQNQCLH